WEKWVLALDGRYVDFRHTAFPGDPAGFDAAGRFTGLGWRSVFAVAAGAQYRLNDTWSFRAGYLGSQNPIPAHAAFFNVGGAVIHEHVLYVGASYNFGPTRRLSIALAHILPNDIAGPFFTPGGPVPGSTVRIDQRAELVEIGYAVNY